MTWRSHAADDAAERHAEILLDRQPGMSKPVVSGNLPDADSVMT